MSDYSSENDRPQISDDESDQKKQVLSDISEEEEKPKEKKKRGRKPKAEQKSERGSTSRRGRPPKNKDTTDDDKPLATRRQVRSTTTREVFHDATSEEEDAKKKRPGRKKFSDDESVSDKSASSSLSSKKKRKGKDKKKKDKKDKKKKDKKDKKNRKKGKSTRKTKVKKNSSSEEDSDDNESDHWSAGDEGVDYGDPEVLSHNSDLWNDKYSEYLYDSDNPDCKLNVFHIESKPRLVELQDLNMAGDIVKLDIESLRILSREEQEAVRKKTSRLKLEDKKEQKADFIDHRVYQTDGFAQPEMLATHNILTQDFIRGVQKCTTCSICQEMVKGPVQIKKCCHRFCSTCIETYNRQGKKECPLCRVPIANRRQMRPDKMMDGLLLSLKEQFEKLARLEELENQEIKRKMILEQKRLKEKKEKQKEKAGGPAPRGRRPADAETKEDRLARLAKEKAQNPQVKKTRGPTNFGGEGVVDTNHVIQLIEEKKQNLPNLLLNVDLEVILKHDIEQSAFINGRFIKRLRFMTNREASLIHVGILLAQRNALREEEWPNFEFYPCLKDNPIKEDRLKKQYINGQLRPFHFMMTILDVLKILFPGQQTEIPTLTLIYKKKPMPPVATRASIVKGLTSQCIIPPVIKDEAIRKHAMPYTPNYNPTNTLQGMLQAKQEQQQQMLLQSQQFKQAQQSGQTMLGGTGQAPPQAHFQQPSPGDIKNERSQLPMGMGFQREPDTSAPSPMVFGKNEVQNPEVSQFAPTAGLGGEFSSMRDGETATNFAFANPK